MSSPKRVWTTIFALAASTLAWAGPEPTPLVRAANALPESNLLDVYITVFEPIDDYLAEARDAEARYMPVELKHTLPVSGAR